MKVKKLFIISKKEILRKTLESYLKKTGVEVFQIDDAVESLHFINDLTPDVILITSGDYDGDQLIPIKNTQIPVVELVKNEDEVKIIGGKNLILPVNPLGLITSIEELFKG